MPHYDEMKRRQGRRSGRERGVWLYVPAVELEAAGIDPKGPAPWYRIYRGRKRQFLVQLYREA